MNTLKIFRYTFLFGIMSFIIYNIVNTFIGSKTSSFGLNLDNNFIVLSLALSGIIMIFIFMSERSIEENYKNYEGFEDEEEDDDEEEEEEKVPELTETEKETVKEILDTKEKELVQQKREEVKKMEAKELENLFEENTKLKKNIKLIENVLRKKLDEVGSSAANETLKDLIDEYEGEVEVLKKKKKTEPYIFSDPKLFENTKMPYSTGCSLPVDRVGDDYLDVTNIL